MAPARPNFITAWNEGKMGDKEFIVACKGRPFSILTAPQFPTPNVTYVDYDLVQSLNIRMSELQCRKLSYCGQKLRILGKISTSVQCIKDGVSCGNLQYKAHVVEDLRKVFDTHSIAGSKLSSKLLGQENYPPTNNSTEPTDEDDTEHSSSEAATTTEPKKKKRKKKKKRTPASVNDSFSSSSTSDHDSDEYNDVYTNISTIRTNDVASMQPVRVFPEPASPRSIALLMRQRCYRAGMNDAQMRKALLCSGVDISAMTEIDTAMTEEDTSTITAVTNSAMTAHPPPFLTITEARESLTANAMTPAHDDDPAEVLHGNDKCTVSCEDWHPDDLPEDCGYHPSYVADDFIPCRLQCPGGWCPCYERWLLWTGDEGGR